MRNFTATAKERQAGMPCFVMIEPHTSIGLESGKEIVFDMPGGTNLKDAEQVAAILNYLDVEIGVI